MIWMSSRYLFWWLIYLLQVVHQSQKESAEALPQLWTLELFHLLASIDIFHLLSINIIKHKTNHGGN